MDSLLVVAAVISFGAFFLLWLISLYRAFSSRDPLWGLLALAFVLPGLIYFFVRGHVRLGLLWLLAFITIAICGGLGLEAILPSIAPNPEP